MSVVAAMGTGSARSPELFSRDLQRLSDFVSLRGQRGGAWAEEVV
jgi:hypothetical protein